MSLTKIPQNVRSKRRSGFEDYVIKVGSKIGRLDFKISGFLGEKQYRNKKKNRAAERNGRSAYFKTYPIQTGIINHPEGH
jgi:hypothetical protein